MGTNNYGTSLIANNVVYGVVSNGTSGDFCVGIYVGNAGTAASTTRIYYNSVSMSGNRDTGGATSQPAFALAILGANPLVDLRDNALYNVSTAGTGGPGGNAGSYAIGLSSTAPYTKLTSNYNDLFTSGASSHAALAISAAPFSAPSRNHWLLMRMAVEGQILVSRPVGASSGVIVETRVGPSFQGFPM
jgi:hypothetical protein